MSVDVVPALAASRLFAVLVAWPSPVLLRLVQARSHDTHPTSNHTLLSQQGWLLHEPWRNPGPPGSACLSLRPSQSRRAWSRRGDLLLEGHHFGVRACILSKVAIAIGVRPFSAPPAIITLASPRRIVSQASPMALLLVAQAEAQPQFGPFAPTMIATKPAAPSTIIILGKNGLMRWGPISKKI